MEIGEIEGRMAFEIEETMTTSKQIEQQERYDALMNDIRAHRIQAEKVKGVIDRMVVPDNTSTMHSRTLAEQDAVQGRWARENRTAVTGQDPTPWVRPNWSNTPGPGQEPFIDGTSCGDKFGVALGEAHEQPREPDLGASLSDQSGQTSSLAGATAAGNSGAQGLLARPEPSRTEGDKPDGANPNSSPTLSPSRIRRR